jgi:carbonic anhydrase
MLLEHTVEGPSFAGEAHRGHKSEAGELAVVGVMIEAVCNAYIARWHMQR